MYNGIGLTTTRGTGTSGHVQRNVASIRGPHRRAGKNNNRNQTVRRKLAETRTGNAAILAHERRRNVEVAVAELEEELRARGYDDDTISTMAERLRNDLLSRDSKEQAACTLDRQLEGRKEGMGAVRLSQVHQVAEITGLRNDKLKDAFNVADDYEEGSVFKKIPEKSNVDNKVPEDQPTKKVDTPAQVATADTTVRNLVPQADGSPSSSSSSVLSSSSSEAAVPAAAEPPVGNEESVSALAEEHGKKRARGGDELLEDTLMKRAKTDTVPNQSEKPEEAGATYGRDERDVRTRSNSPLLSRGSSSYSRWTRSSFDDPRENHRYRSRSMSPRRYSREPRGMRRDNERWRSPSPRRLRERSPVRWDRRSHRRYDSRSRSDSWSSRSISPGWRRRSRSPHRRRERKGRRASISNRDKYYRSRSQSRSPSSSDSYEWRSPPRYRRRMRSRERYYSRDFSSSPSPRDDSRGRYRSADVARRDFNEGKRSRYRDDAYELDGNERKTQYYERGGRDYRYRRSVSPRRYYSPDRSYRYDAERSWGRLSRAKHRSPTPLPGTHR